MGKMDFKERRAKFLLDLLACNSIGEVTRLAGKQYGGTGPITAKIIVANVDVQPIVGSWKCYYDAANLDNLEGVCNPQVWTQGGTKLLWWEPESGRYVEFLLRDY